MKRVKKMLELMSAPSSGRGDGDVAEVHPFTTRAKELMELYKDFVTFCP